MKKACHMWDTKALLPAALVHKHQSEEMRGSSPTLLSGGQKGEKQRRQAQFICLGEKSCFCSVVHLSLLPLRPWESGGLPVNFLPISHARGMPLPPKLATCGCLSLHLVLFWRLLLIVKLRFPPVPVFIPDTRKAVG